LLRYLIEQKLLSRIPPSYRPSITSADMEPEARPTPVRRPSFRRPPVSTAPFGAVDHEGGESIGKVDVARMRGSKSQRAMALAMRYPTPEKGGRGIKKTVEVVGFSEKRLSQARMVLRHSRRLAEQVRAGTLSLDQALTQMQAKSAAPER
jgi:hypothetical protein